MAKRTARDFSRRLIAKVAVMYAGTDASYSSEYFCREFEITQPTFYKLLEKAVVENIVELEIVEAIKKKSAYNALRKAGKNAEKRSQKHYEHLIQKRKLFVLSKKESIALTKAYISTDLDKQKFCHKEFCTTELLNRTILKSMLENWISDEDVNKLKEKSLKKESTPRAIEFWEKVESYRNANKENQG